jgi:AraC-like DNA-binding protein
VLSARVDNQLAHRARYSDDLVTVGNLAELSRTLRPGDIRNIGARGIAEIEVTLAYLGFTRDHDHPSRSEPDGLRPHHAEPAAAIVTGLRDGRHGQIPAAGEPGTGPAAAGCPVCGCQPAQPHPGLPAGRTGLLLAWLASNYHRPGLRAGEMAAAAGVSIRVLQATCKRDLGTTPRQLLTDIRLHHAHLRLTSLGPAPRSVAEVARSAGFTRAARFSAAYRRRYGTPPAITARITPAPPVQEHHEH